MTLTRRAAAAGLAAAPLAACGAGRAKGTLEFWAMGREGEVAGQLTPAFEAENPGVKVKVQQLPWTSAHEKLLTAFAGGALPDVCQVGNTWLPEFSAIGALTPLAPFLAAAPGFGQADYFPGIWDTNLVAGRLFGIPWYVDTRLLFYRRDLAARAGFPNPPRTWAEWLAAMRAIKRAAPENYAALLPLNEYEPLMALAQQQADPLLKANATLGNFQSAGFKKALGFYAGIFREQLAPAKTNTEISNLYDEFDRGFFSYYITGPWNIGEFKRRLPAAHQDRWMTAPLPGPDGPAPGIAGGASLAILATARDKPAAWKLIEYLSRPATQVKFHALTGNLPPRRAAWAGALDGDIHAAAFRKQLELVKPAPQAPEWERIATEMRLVSEQLVGGRLTVDQAAAEMDRRADRLLEKRRWMLAGGQAA